MPVGIVRAERKTKNMQVIKRKAAIPIPASAFEESRDTVVYWLSGAGFLVHSRSTNILIDPVLMKKEEKNPEEGTPAISEIGLPAEEQRFLSTCRKFQIIVRCYIRMRTEIIWDQ